MELNNIHKKDIAEIGRKYSLCGGENLILMDGDLEEFLSDNNMSFGEFIYLKEPVYNEDAGIGNFNEGELMGFAELKKQNESKYFKIYCSRYSSHLPDEYISFTDDLSEEDTCFINMALIGRTLQEDFTVWKNEQIKEHPLLAKEVARIWGLLGSSGEYHVRLTSVILKKFCEDNNITLIYYFSRIGMSPVYTSTTYAQAFLDFMKKTEWKKEGTYKVNGKNYRYKIQQ